MPLFQVPGWKVPDAGPTESPASKKRKRRSSDESLHSKLNSAHINFDSLVRKISGSALKSDADGSDKAEKKKEKKKQDTEKSAKKMSKAEKKKAAISGPMKLGHGSKKGSPPAEESNKKEKKGKEKAAQGQDLEPVNSRASTVSQPPAKRIKKEGSIRLSTAESHAPLSVKEPETEQVDASLTKLQREMKESLDGARFRQINEQLYKSDSKASHELLKSDPKVFQDYHTGFRHQVHSWPTNPVDTYISTLSSYPPRTVIADLGCGDAQLAKSLVKEGLNVLSFDLVASEYVIEADICQYIPLPGSAPEKEQTGAAIVDVVVCSLALMGTNWPACIREAWRILKDEGELKIAEVSSRFTDMKKFIELIKQVGFRLVSKDESNTHFVMLEFVKDAKKSKLKSDANVEALMNRGSLLKACEYKKR